MTDKLTAGGMDVAATLARFGGNENLFLKFLRRFPTDKTIGTLDAAMQSGVRADIKTTCHTLKGISGNLGLTPLFDACAAMMTELRASDDSDVTALYDTVKAEHAKAVAMVLSIDQ